MVRLIFINFLFLFRRCRLMVVDFFLQLYNFFSRFRFVRCYYRAKNFLSCILAKNLNATCNKKITVFFNVWEQLAICLDTILAL